MDVQALADLYSIGALQSIASMKPGTASQVWRLTASGHDFVLRTLSSPLQGDQEWGIFRHLLSRGFTRTPTILIAQTGKPWVEQAGTCYQLQTVCPGNMPDPIQPGIPREMAETAVALAQALSDCPVADFSDPYDLSAIWPRARQNWPLLALPLSLDEADRQVSIIAAMSKNEGQVVHGDLGPWNMLTGADGLWVIDFGAARIGDPYFDLATALSGLVNHAPLALRDALAQEYLARCAALLPRFDPARLSQQLRLWAWRGLAQWALSAAEGPISAQMAARFYAALTWSEEFFA